MVGEIKRLLDGGIAAADHRDVFAPEKETVAGRAGRNPEPLKGRLALEAEPARLGAGGNDDRLREIDVAPVPGAAERTTGEVDIGDQVVDQGRADIFRLKVHLLHQPGPLDHVGEPGVVLHIGGNRHLSADFEPGHQDRIERRARGVDGGGVPGGAGTDDQDFGVMGLGHGRSVLTRRSFRHSEWAEN